MSDISVQSVQDFFDLEARAGRRLLPSAKTVSGLGTLSKYRLAADTCAKSSVERVLDIGCNRGSIEFLFHSLHEQKAKNTHMEGLDISEEAIRQARKLNLPNCKFQSYSGGRLPFENEQFDLVVLVEVIEHVVDKNELLDEIYRVLKPSGKLFLTTPNPDCWPLQIESKLMTALRIIFRKPLPEKDAFITHADLAVALANNGFETPPDHSMYYWPRLFLQLMGWGVCPPLPPSGLYQYQRLVSSLFGSQAFSPALRKRLHWSLACLAEKKQMTQATQA